MDFTKRSADLLSCSALPRVRACPGSFILSKGVEDDQSKAADDGQKIHDHIAFLATNNASGKECVDDELATQAAEMWHHAERSARQFFGQDAQLIWKSEERKWMSSDDLLPILSGQFDLTCESESSPQHLLLYDFKSGFLANEVPQAEFNEQIDGMAAILQEETGKSILAAIVRPWASDQLVEMRPEWVRPWVESVYEITDANDAGLKTGKHCRYCPARRAGKCPLMRDQLALVLKTDIALSMAEMSPDNLSRILKASKPAESVIEAAKEEAKKRHANKEFIPGISFSPGAKKRIVSDFPKLYQLLEEEGVDIVAIKSDIDITLGQAEAAYIKAKNLKKGKDASAKFNKLVGAALDWKENSPSIVIEE